MELDYHLAAGRAYTVTQDRKFRVVTAWQLGRSLRRLWTARIAAGEVGPGGIAVGGVRIEQPGDVVLVADGPATTVLDARTGGFRWAVAGSIRPLDGGRAGLAVTDVVGSTGHVEMHGVDLRTGRRNWSVARPGVLTFPAPGSALLVLRAGRLQRLDGATGAVVGEAGLPKAAGQIAPNLVGILFVVDYGRPESGGRTVAYDAVTLARRWDRSRPAATVDPGACLGLICSGPRAALDVLDPGTGRPAWRVPGEVNLRAAGGYVLELTDWAGQPVRLVDPVTGANRVPLDGWNEVIGEHPLVLRRAAPGGRSVFGVVPPGRDWVQPLGETTGPVSACRADSGYLVCRGSGDLRIWAYRV